MIVEIAYAVAGVPLTIEDIPWEDVGPDSRRLAALNPLGQVPTLVLPNGTVMTESAAILLHLGERRSRAKLAPPPGHRQRAEFLRWLVFLVAAVYPTYTYGDGPARWVGEDAAPKLRESTDAHRQRLLQYLDRHAAGPWFLGKRFSALDIYLPVIRLWRPRAEWWRANVPKLNTIADRCEKLAPVAKAFARNA